MTTVRDASGLNESRQRAASSSAFPPALPPKHPVTLSVSAHGNGNAHVVPPLLSDGNGAVVLHHPLITAADYSDRNRLLSHISFLSGQLQLAELLLQNAPRTALSDEELARFDPILAQRHIERLDTALAQISLLREVETGAKRALEEELHGLRDERNRAVERVDTLESRVAMLEKENKELYNTLSSSQLEVERLRLEENNLNRKLLAIDRLQEEGGRYQGVNVIVAPPRHTETQHGVNREMVELQMEETSQRLSLLLDMMMEPIWIAFDAGVVWITETQLHRASVQIDNEVVPEVHNDSDELPTIARVQSPLGDGGDGVVLSLEEHSALLRRQQELCSELEEINERCRNAQQQKQRVQYLLQEEQRRTESMAREHCQQLEQVHKQMVQERRQIMESLATEVEERMRNAFRDGRLHERRLTEEKMEKRRLNAAHTNTFTVRHHAPNNSAQSTTPISEGCKIAGKEKKRNGTTENARNSKNKKHNSGSRSSSSSSSCRTSVV